MAKHIASVLVFVASMMALSGVGATSWGAAAFGILLLDSSLLKNLVAVPSAGAAFVGSLLTMFGATHDTRLQIAVLVFAAMSLLLREELSRKKTAPAGAKL